MPNPVSIPVGPLPITPQVNQRAEELLARIVQVVHAGSQGATPDTPPTIVPTSVLGKTEALALVSSEQQRMYRQLSVAIASTVPAWIQGDSKPSEGQNVGEGHGVFKDRLESTLRFRSLLSGDGVIIEDRENEIVISSESKGFGVHNDLEGRNVPDTHPIPAITNLQETLDEKAGNLWVEGEFAKRDRLWFFDATAPSNLEVGTLVYLKGRLDVDIADPSTRATMPAVGVIVRRNESTVTVQVAGIVENVFRGLTPGQMYFTDYEGRLSPTPPVPPSGGFAYFQAVGVALDEDLLDLSPSMNMTRRG